MDGRVARRGLAGASSAPWRAAADIGSARTGEAEPEPALSLLRWAGEAHLRAAPATSLPEKPNGPNGFRRQRPAGSERSAGSLRPDRRPGAGRALHGGVPHLVGLISEHEPEPGRVAAIRHRRRSSTSSANTSGVPGRRTRPIPRRPIGRRTRRRPARRGPPGRRTLSASAPVDGFSGGGASADHADHAVDAVVAVAARVPGRAVERLRASGLVRGAGEDRDGVRSRRRSTGRAEPASRRSGRARAPDSASRQVLPPSAETATARIGPLPLQAKPRPRSARPGGRRSRPRAR